LALRPCSFSEFLGAIGENQIKEKLLSVKKSPKLLWLDSGIVSYVAKNQLEELQNLNLQIYSFQIKRVIYY